MALGWWQRVQHHSFSCSLLPIPRLEHRTFIYYASSLHPQIWTVSSSGTLFSLQTSRPLQTPHISRDLASSLINPTPPLSSTANCHPSHPESCVIPAPQISGVCRDLPETAQIFRKPGGSLEDCHILHAHFAGGVSIWVVPHERKGHKRHEKNS